jgi:hypothetical protein
MSRMTLVSLLFGVGVCLSVSGGVAAQALPSQKDLKPCPESPESPSLPRGRVNFYEAGSSQEELSDH